MLSYLLVNPFAKNNLKITMNTVCIMSRVFLLQANRDYVIGQIMLACTEIIKIVEARGDLDQTIEEPGYMAATLEKVYSQNRAVFT